jgi:hypothetical protein
LISRCHAGDVRFRAIERSFDANPINPRRAPRARPPSRLTLAPGAWHRPAQARRAPVAGLGHFPQHLGTGGGRKPVSRQPWRRQWPHARRCSIAWLGRLRSCAPISTRWLWQTRRCARNCSVRSLRQVRVAQLCGDGFSELLGLLFRRSDHAQVQIGDELLLAFVAVRRQDPVVCAL